MKERMKNGYFCIIFLLIMFCGITAWDGTCALAEGQENGTAAQVSAVKSEDAQSAESSKDAFAVRIPEEATGFRDNIIHVETAQSGVVTITVTQEDGICRYISSAQVRVCCMQFRLLILCISMARKCGLLTVRSARREQRSWTLFPVMTHRRCLRVYRSL